MTQHLCPDHWQVSDKSRVIKKKRAPPRFLSKWLNDPAFQGWLQSRFNEKKKMITAYCTTCHQFLTNGRSDLVDHEKTPKHQACLERMEASEAERRLLLDFTRPASAEKAQIRARIIMAIAIAERNIPFLFADWLVPAMKRAFYDSELLKNFKMKRTTLTNVIRFGNINRMVQLILSVNNNLFT